MRRPGEQCGKGEVEDGIAGDRGQDFAGGAGFLRRTDGLAEEMEGEKHQAEADGAAAEVVDARRPPAAESDEASGDKQGEDQSDVEGEHLNDQRRADIGAEHHRQCRHQVDQPGGGQRRCHQGGRGARLQDGGDAESREKRAPARGQAAGEDAPDVGAERAHHARLDHVDPPQQQGDLADDVDEDAGGRHAFVILLTAVFARRSHRIRPSSWRHK